MAQVHRSLFLLFSILILKISLATISPDYASFTIPGSSTASEIYSVLSTGGGTVIVAVDPISPAATNSTTGGTILYALNSTDSSSPILAQLSLPPCHSWMIPNPLVFGFMLVCKQMTNGAWSTTTIFRIDYGLQSFVNSDPISSAYISIVSDINQQRFLAFSSDGSLYSISWNTFAPQLVKSNIIPSTSSLVSASLVSDGSALLITTVTQSHSYALTKFGAKAFKQINSTSLSSAAYLMVADEQKPTTTLFTQMLAGAVQLVSFDLSHMTALEVRNVTSASYLPSSDGSFLWNVVDESLFFVTAIPSGEKRAGPNSLQLSQSMLQNGFLPDAPSTVTLPSASSSNASVALSADGNFVYIAQGLVLYTFSYTTPPAI